jgi:hypothetical protein
MDTLDFVDNLCSHDDVNPAALPLFATPIRPSKLPSKRAECPAVLQVSPVYLSEFFIYMLIKLSFKTFIQCLKIVF